MDEEDRKLMEKMERLKIFSELGSQAVWERYKTLSTVSSLAATLLVVATFNENLIAITSVTKFLLTVLLSLIPICLIGFLYELHRSEVHSRQKINEIDEKENKKEVKPGIMNYLPWLVTGILTIVILWIIFLIWNCQ